MSRETAKEELLGTGRSRRWVGRTVTLLVIAALCAGGAWWYMNGSAVKKMKYSTVDVSRGDLTVTVSANGTLNPVREVSIGSELSGTIAAVYVDVNSEVKQGDVLFELDLRKLKSTERQAQAALSMAKAQLAEAEATLFEANAKMKRYQDLNKSSGGKLPSRNDMDEQKATVMRAEAAVLTAKASIEDSEATLATAQTDIGKAAVTAPVDGVILARSAEPGYAVAATLQAVELLTLATDLHELELQVDVDEADVGQVKPGQKATFTVASYPNRDFPADLTKVAYGSTTSTDNVVTYTAYMSVKNPDLALRPGMTATATISTAEKKGALLIPNTALRFRPQVEETSGGATSFLMPGPGRDRRSTRKAEETASSSPKDREIYVLKDGAARKVLITTGLTDGTMTEVLSGSLQEGDKVIVDQLKGSQS